MTYKDLMLDLVLGDKSLKEKYRYDDTDINDVDDAMHSDDTIIHVIGKIINEININNLTDTDRRNLYNNIFTELNSKLIL